MLETTVIGNAGQVRFHNSENAKVLSISIAASRRVSADKTYTDWITAKVWGERAIALQPHIFKGQRLLVRGRPEVSAYTRADGQPAADLIVHVRDMEFVGPKPTEIQPSEEKPKSRRRRQAVA